MSFGERELVRGGKIVKVPVVQFNQIAIEKALIEGDLAALDVSQRLQYVKMVCKSVKLNPLTKPFDYLRFQGKVILYLNRGGAEQLRKIHKISIQNVLREISKERETYTVIVKAVDKDGREEDGMGVVSIAGLRGEGLSNAYMKCETKAKRRATLAICGLSAFDAQESIEEPIRQSEIEERIAQVTAKVEAPVITEEEKEALVNETPAVSEDLPPAPPTEKGYKMQSGRNRGKFLKDLSKAKLNKWMAWYNELREKGSPLSAGVQDDAFAIQAHLSEPPNG